MKAVLYHPKSDSFTATEFDALNDTVVWNNEEYVLAGVQDGKAWYTPRWFTEGSQ